MNLHTVGLFGSDTNYEFCDDLTQTDLTVGDLRLQPYTISYWIVAVDLFSKLDRLEVEFINSAGTIGIHAPLPVN